MVVLLLDDGVPEGLAWEMGHRPAATARGQITRLSNDGCVEIIPSRKSSPSKIGKTLSEPSIEPPTPEPAMSDLYVAYAALSARRYGYDAMLWQTPALAVTAQAFLLTIALGKDSSATARLISSALSFILSLMSVQLMAKHRQNESLDSFMLERFEDRIGLSAYLKARPHGRPASRVHADDKGKPGLTLSTNWFWRQSSYKLWLTGLGLFGVASLSIFVVVVTRQANSVFG